jgi:hypothetical protein
MNLNFIARRFMNNTKPDPHSEYYRGVREAFNMVNMINAGSKCNAPGCNCSRTPQALLKEIVNTLSRMVNGGHD